MIRFFKRLYQAIVRFFSPEMLFYDHIILFKRAPLIGKVFHNGNKMFRVIDYELFRGRWKCYLDLI